MPPVLTPYLSFAVLWASSASGEVHKSPALGIEARACMGKGSAQQESCAQPSFTVYLKKNPTRFCTVFVLNSHLLLLLIFSGVVYSSTGGGFQSLYCASDPKD